MNDERDGRRKHDGKYEGDGQTNHDGQNKGNGRTDHDRQNEGNERSGHPEQNETSSRIDRNDDGLETSFELPTGTAAMGGDAPLAALAEELRERRERERSIGEPFEEVDVSEVDTDVLWEQVLSEDEPAVDSGDRDVRTVPKRAYCERCQYFSSPPAVNCTHEGTEILELVGTDRFTVVDCPIVRENERLGGSVE